MQEDPLAHQLLRQLEFLAVQLEPECHASPSEPAHATFTRSPAWAVVNW